LFKTCISKEGVVNNSSFATQSVKYISVRIAYFSPIFGHHHVLHSKHLLYNHISRSEDNQYKNI